MGVATLPDRPIIGSNEDIPDALVIGQEQDSVKGRYELSQMFNGEISELNIWDKSVDDQTILAIAKCQNSEKGNIVSWDRGKYLRKNVKLVDNIDPTFFCQKEYNCLIYFIKYLFSGPYFCLSTCVIFNKVIFSNFNILQLIV